MMVRNMEDTGLFLIIITAYKVKLTFFRHIRSRYRDVFISGNVHAFTVIVLIIFPCGDWEPGYIPLAVVHHRMDIRREDGLGMVIDRHCRVGPPEECLRSRGPVI